nr:TetR family transcriptional regulator [Pseudonocardia sp. C8]
MFSARGFPAVRMEDIAGAVGVTARALYRHYPNKRALLFHVTTALQDLYFDALTDPGDVPARDPAQLLVDAVGRLAGVTLDGRSHALLWQREARHLDPDQRAVVRARVAEVAQRIAAMITATRSRPTGDPDTELLAWAALAVLASPGHHGEPLPRPATDALLRHAALAVVTTDLRSPGATDAAGPQGYVQEPALPSRRETLLRASARLFRQHGYPAVTMEDIGESAGILGASIYHHFPSKGELLVTLVRRFQDWLTLALFNARGRTTDPAEALRLLTVSYIELALRFPDLVSVAVTEVLYLPDEDHDQLRRARADIIAEWAGLLHRTRPELDGATCVLLVHAAVAVVDDVVRIPHLHHDALGAQLLAITHTIFAGVGRG